VQGEKVFSCFGINVNQKSSKNKSGQFNNDGLNGLLGDNEMESKINKNNNFNLQHNSLINNQYTNII